ncbi:MAG: helix-turn-helix domain-containing protein, partial [Telluria sp.]
MNTLSERRNDLTRTIILDSGIAVLESAPVSELTVRAAAKHAGMSERTVFRYFPSREELLDAIAEHMRMRLDLPPPPTSVEALLEAPDLLYRAYEAKTSLIKAALHSEIFHRIREEHGRARLSSLQELLARLAPHCAEQERKIAAANIRYYLTATTWHYYR